MTDTLERRLFNNLLEKYGGETISHLGKPFFDDELLAEFEGPLFISYKVKKYAEYLTLNSDGSHESNIQAIVGGLHSVLEYEDEPELYGKYRTAQEVYEDKRGCCVSMSALAYSMLNHLGVESKFVESYSGKLSFFRRPHTNHIVLETNTDAFGRSIADITSGECFNYVDKRRFRGYLKKEKFISEHY